MTRLTRCGFQLCSKLPEYFTGVTVNWQQRLAPQPREGAQALLPDSCIAATSAPNLSSAIVTGER
jgi:hypothetical protein